MFWGIGFRLGFEWHLTGSALFLVDPECLDNMEVFGVVLHLFYCFYYHELLLFCVWIVFYLNIYDWVLQVILLVFLRLRSAQTILLFTKLLGHLRNRQGMQTLAILLKILNIITFCQDLLNHGFCFYLVIVYLFLLLKFVDEFISEFLFHPARLGKFLFCVENWNLVSIW